MKTRKTAISDFLAKHIRVARTPEDFDELFASDQEVSGPPDDVEADQMSIRVDVQSDREESLHWIARATLDANRLHEIRKPGGLAVRDAVVREMGEWLKRQGYPVPDHYRLKRFEEGRVQWVEQSFAG